MKIYVSTDIATHALMKVVVEEIVEQSEKDPWGFTVTQAVDMAKSGLSAVKELERREEERRGVGE